MSFVLFGERPYVWYCNLVLMLCYAAGELGHFLLGTTSQSMAQSIHFGDQGCLAINDTFHDTCSNFTSKTRCDNITADGDKVCQWNYTGSGLEYQLLAGPFFVAIFTVMGVALGALGDRYSRVKILSVCVFICSATVLLTGFSNQYWQLALLRLAFGGAEAGFSPLSASIIADIFKDTSRGLAMSVFNWGIYFGFGSAFAVGNLVTGADINGEGWRWAYYMSGIPGLILVLFLITSVHEPTRKNVAFTSTDNDKKENVDKTHDLSLFHKVWTAIKIIGTRLSLIALLIGACVRHSASFCFAYNAQLYFSEYYPHTNLGLWMSLSSIVGGSIGIASGGLISDLVVKRYGICTRLSVLAVSQTLASPLAFGVLYIEPPYCFISLIGAYLFAEMWFGILFAVLVELFPTAVRSTSMATFFFVINNVAGLILLIVPSLKHSMGTRQALTLVYPGFYLISAVFFILAQFLLKREFNMTEQTQHGLEETEPMSEKPDDI